jgi:putative ABC transport system permease protein
MAFRRHGPDEFDAELESHIDLHTADNIRAGMSPDEARRQARVALGGVEQAKARRRDGRRTNWLDEMAQDIKFAVRMLVRDRGFALTVVVVLALGIGANSAMFSVVNHLLLNPLPYPDADRIVAVFQEPSEGNNTGVTVTITPMGRLVAAWRNTARSFESIEPYKTTDVTLQRPGEPARVAHTAAILPSFATFAGQRPLVGRVFTEAEAKGEASVVMLSEGMWRSQYGAKGDVVGTTISVNEKPMTIVGVMPGVFRLPRTSDGDMDLWLPLDLVRSDDDGLHAIARLRPGVTREAATKELDAIALRTEPDRATALRFKAKVAGPAELVRFQDSIIMLTVAVALVLLIACANVAHLLLARASTRQREMAIRAALGAGGGRLFRQLLTESMILSTTGCIGGLVIGWAGLRMLVAARPESLSELAAARMDGTTVMVTAVIAIATGLLFGLIGAVQASRHSTHDALKSDTLGASGGRKRGGARRLLVVTEMALCTMLLVGAALLLRSVRHLQQRDAGFDARGLYALEVELPQDRYQLAARAGFFNELAERARAIPGVHAVTQASAGPPSMSFLLGALQLEGQPDPARDITELIPYNGVGPEFFAVMGIRLIQGTTFTDTSTAAAQAIVNEGFARKHWPNTTPIGRRVRVVYNGQGEWRTIVGVARNTLTQGLTHDASDPLLYMPSSDMPPPQMTSVELAMHKSIARPRFTMFLLLVFTIVAVGLAAVGLYGVMAYTVAQRTREIGIRMALGASRRVVARSVLSQGLVLAGLGALLGLIAARGSAKLLGTMLYGVQQTDPASFALSAVLLVVVAVTACLVPMRRALRVDPVIAMRSD